VRTFPGSFLLFRLWGISVFLHWSWLIIAAFFYYTRPMDAHPGWHVATYVSLFAIVLMHEFGHAMACRSVGGQADTIVLWPLGGIAFVNPPLRPGAVLWSIAAGPLVNVLIVPVTIALLVAVGMPEDPRQGTDIQKFVFMLASINLILLLFNMLPIYPLDGGQIVQAILWFFMGRAKSLRITAGFGLVCAVAAIAWALWIGDTWLMIIAAFIAWRSWDGVQVARHLAAREAATAPQARGSTWPYPPEAREPSDRRGPGPPGSA
jgi:Zn-dependent protease